MQKPPVRRIETATGHYYVDHLDRQIPGVTTILKCLPKAALDAWTLRKAVDLALKGGKGCPEGTNIVDWCTAAGERESLVAAAVGTNAHNFAEQYMLGNDPDIEALAKKERHHAECFLHFVRDYQPKPVLVEKVVTYIDPKLGIPLYCGTIDLIAELNDNLTWLVDYKASSGKPRPSHALQSAAYRWATHWIDEETGKLVEMPPVDKTAVILLNGGAKDKCYRMYRLDSSEVVFSVFKSLLKINNFSKIEDRVIMGEM